MPIFIPLILWGLGAAAAAVGTVKNVVDGSDDRESAESIANNSKSLFKSQETRLENTRKLLYTDAAEYGKFAYETKEKTFGRLVAVSKTIGKSVKVSNLQENTSEAIDVKFKIEDFHKDAMNASEILGALVLGGITLAAFTVPAALIGSWSYKAKGEEILTQAYRHKAEIEIAVEKMKGIQKFLKSVRKQIQETQHVIAQLITFAEQQMNVVEQTVKTKSYKQDKVLVPYKLACHLCKGIKEILDANILDAKGNFNKEFPQIVQKYKKEVSYESF